VVSALGEREARARREGNESGERCGEARGGCSPFIGVEGAAGRGGRAANTDVNVFNDIEDGRLDERLRIGIKGGEMKARWEWSEGTRCAGEHGQLEVGDEADSRGPVVREMRGRRPAREGMI
jgi:hypothetical protein